MTTPTDRERQWLLAEKHGGVESPAFFRDLELLMSGEPLAYLIGYVPFLDATIRLDSRPLIPRSETEYWTERAIAELSRSAEPLRILDLCAGSGAIGIAVLDALPHTHVDFVELMEAHHETIRTNLSANEIDPTRAEVFGGDLFSHLPKDRRYDAILTNPPYLAHSLERADTEVLAHEPHEALVGGEEGTELIERIITEAPRHLERRGVLYLEHEPEQAGAIALYARDTYATCETLRDQYGVERYTRLALL